MVEEFKSYVTFARSDDPLRIRLIGETYCNKNFCIERECSDLNAFEFIVDGSGVLDIDGQHLIPEKGDVFFLKFGTKHRYYSDAENPWHKFWIVFDGKLASSLIDCYLPKNTYLFKNCPIGKTFERIVSLSRQDMPYENMLNQVTLCLMDIFMYIRNRIKIDREDLPELIRKKLDESVEEKFNLDVLCESINYSKNYVINVFKSKYNLTPYKYFLDKKLDAAKAYLTHTNMSVNSIAETLHYSDQQYFSASFKQATGFSPLEFRKITRK